MGKIKGALNILKNEGMLSLLKRISSRIIRERIKEYSYIKSLFTDKKGVEIGGPSWVFNDKGFIPIYKVIKELDGCNFAETTIWEGKIENGAKYNYHKDKLGTQYISDATDLSLIPNEKYEFVISSNCLEHVANPLKAIEEWIRVIKSDGLILLVLPNKEYCFDHNRPITEFSHMLNDYQNKTKEDDLTHLEEILKLHDLSMDKPAGTPEQFKERSLKNYYNRTLHQHVFSINTLKEIFDYFHLEMLLTHEGPDFIVLGRKTSK